MQTFEATRPTVGAQAIGIARAAYEYSLDYAKERTQFGRPIIENQAIAFALADMAMEIDAARLLVWRAAWMGRTGREFHNAEGSMSKLKAERGRGVVDRARDPDPRRQRLHARVPGRAHAPRREDLHDLRGHERDPAARHQPGDLGHDDPLMDRDLDPVEIRVLGCLIEKQRTTPDQYPLSLNALRNACNQSTNRFPVVRWDEELLRAALQKLGRRRYSRLDLRPHARAPPSTATCSTRRIAGRRRRAGRARGAVPARRADARRAQAAHRAHARSTASTSCRTSSPA